MVETSVATFLRNDVAACAETCRMLGNFALRSVLNKIAAPVAVEKKIMRRPCHGR
jgi:hypothetical protein